ncbi:MAG: hypothetical protein ACI867_000156 [Glaciecola sp.]
MVRPRKVAIGLGAAVLGVGVIAALMSRQPSVHNLKLGDGFNSALVQESIATTIAGVQTPQGAAAVALHDVPGDLEGSTHRGMH